MNIVAVIPARAGSKGIPNKNIRILNGKPMISYCIQNALDSKYITNIIVSTDSQKIAQIARKMKVNVRMRGPELCGDDVTLDAVVYDAIKDIKSDVVITLQPTSPTLRCDTLDLAIEYFLESKKDTVISVINRPHLSWKLENNKKVPDYERRLNRQFLPPHYLETGAFLISKSCIVNENTRIGNDVDVYEVSEQEAIDIDSFSDMIVAEQYISEKRVAIWVNGNNEIGLGHIFRVMELADGFYCKPDIYYDINRTDKSVFGNTTHMIIGVDGYNGFYEKIKSNNYNLIVNDDLDTSSEHMRTLRELSCAQIVNFEDSGSGAEKADLVINALYTDDKYCITHKYGEKYYVLPSNFLLYSPIEIKKEVEKVFICFGGADPQMYTDRILKIINNEKYSTYTFTVVLGKAKKNVDELMRYSKNNIRVLYDVDNIAELMSDSDIAITSRGRTGYELASLGIPTIAMAQNQREELHEFICEKNGFIYLGKNPSDYIIESNIDMFIKMDRADRKELQDKLLKHDLKSGRERVMKLLNSL